MTYTHGDAVTGEGVEGTIVNVSGNGPLTNIGDVAVFGVQVSSGEIRFYRADALTAAEPEPVESEEPEPTV